MQKDSAADLKVLQEWFETNRIRETGIIENVQKQPASPERDEMRKGFYLFSSTPIAFFSILPFSNNLPSH